MLKGYFDQSSPEWVVPLRDKAGKPLDFGKGKVHSSRDKSDPHKTWKFRIERLVWGQQTCLPEKVNFIAEIRWEDRGTGCWLCYYILNRHGRWAFGQYGPMIPVADLKELYQYAHEKGVVP